MHSIIEFDLSNCSIRHCYIEEKHKQYTLQYPRCWMIKIKGDYRDMTEDEIKKRCLMKIRDIVDSYLSIL